MRTVLVAIVLLGFSLPARAIDEPPPRPVPETIDVPRPSPRVPSPEPDFEASFGELASQLVLSGAIGAGVTFGSILPSLMLRTSDSVGIGIGVGALVSPLVSLPLLRWVSAVEPSWAFWEAYLLSASIRLATLVAAVGLERVATARTEASIVIGVPLSLAAGAIAEAVVSNVGRRVTRRAVSMELPLSFGAVTGLGYRPLDRLPLGVDAWIGVGRAGEDGSFRGARVHTALLAWALIPPRTPARGFMVDIGYLSQTPFATGGRAEPFYAWWIGPALTVFCPGDVCGGVGVATGAALGVRFPLENRSALEMSAHASLGLTWPIPAPVLPGVSLTYRP